MKKYSQSKTFFFSALIIACYLGIPFGVISGWLRWWRSSETKRVFSVLSLIGLSAATVSTLLAIGTAIYARAIGGFPYYDPRLMRIYGFGLLLSLGSSVLSLGGIFRRSVLRWHAPAVSAGMLTLWVLWMSNE